jgi:hypothetical protein
MSMEAKGFVQRYSYWILTDVFEENSMPNTDVQGCFELPLLPGVAKPVHFDFEVLHLHSHVNKTFRIIMNGSRGADSVLNECVDDDCASATRAGIDIGKPSRPSLSESDHRKAASRHVPEPPSWTRDWASLILDVSLLQSIAAITVQQLAARSREESQL